MMLGGSTLTIHDSRISKLSSLASIKYLLLSGCFPTALLQPMWSGGIFKYPSNLVYHFKQALKTDLIQLLFIRIYCIVFFHVTERIEVLSFIRLANMGIACSL
jgi:hypothetical protein